MHRLHAHERQTIPARQQTAGARTAGEMQMLFETRGAATLLLRPQARERDEVAMQHVVGFGAQNVGETAGHAGTEIQTQRTEHQNDAAGHVFAAVLADAFDHRERAAVAHRKAFAGSTGNVKLARTWRRTERYCRRARRRDATQQSPPRAKSFLRTSPLPT